MAGGNKAHFENLDTNAVFFVQFNPKEFKLDESAAWKDSDEFQQDKPLLTFDRGKPSTAAMELVFDTTDSGANVHDQWVKPLRSFVSVNVEETKEGKQIKRPPFVKFVWNNFTFECVVEKVGVQFLMFAADGTPLRAKVSLSLKENKDTTLATTANAPITLSAMQSMMQASGKDKTYNIKDGETLSQVAKKTGGDYKLIAAANNIANPMEPPPGPVIIPSGAVMAGIFEFLGKSEAPAAWGDFKPNLNPDSAISDDWSIEKGEFVFELTAEAEITFSSYMGEEVEANVYVHAESAISDGWDITKGEAEHKYADDNVAEFSAAYGGEVVANEYLQGDSQAADGWDITKGEAEHKYGAENEAKFSDKYSGDVAKNDYTQGDSQVSDGWDTSKNAALEHEYGAENEAKFSGKYSGEVAKNDYTQGESQASDGWDTSKNDIAHANKQEEQVQGAAANTGKGAHSSDASAGGAAGGKGAHSSDSSAGGAATGEGQHSSDMSAGGAAGGKGAHSSDSSAGGANGQAAAEKAAQGASGKGQDAAEASADKAGGAAAKAGEAPGGGASAGREAGASAAGQAAAEKSAQGAGGAAGQAAAEKSAAEAGGKAGDAAGGAKGAADGAAEKASAAPNVAAPKAGGGAPSAGAKAADAVAQSGGAAAKDAGPPPEVLKSAPGAEKSITGRPVNPGDSKTTNFSRDLSAVVAEAENTAKEVDKATDEHDKLMAEAQLQAETIAAKAKMHADRIADKDVEATKKK